MKEHLIYFLYEQFKFNCIIHHFNSIGIEISKFELNNNQIVLDLIGFPQDGIVESDIGPDHDTYSRQRLGYYFEGIVERMIENEAVTMTNDGLNISEDYELFIKGELNKYVEMLLNELDNPNLLGQDFYLAREQNNLPLNLRCPRMTSVLYVHFDVGFKSGSPDLKIHSPLVLPTKGETVDFEMEEFFG